MSISQGINFVAINSISPHVFMAEELKCSWLFILVGKQRGPIGNQNNWIDSLRGNLTTPQAVRSFSNYSTAGSLHR